MKMRFDQDDCKNSSWICIILFLFERKSMFPKGLSKNYVSQILKSYVFFDRKSMFPIYWLENLCFLWIGKSMFPAVSGTLLGLRVHVNAMVSVDYLLYMLRIK